MRQLPHPWFSHTPLVRSPPRLFSLLPREQNQSAFIADTVFLRSIARAFQPGCFFIAPRTGLAQSLPTQESHMLRILPLFLVLATGLAPASAATLSRTYSYFTIGGLTLPEIEQQLMIRGPRLDSTGQRHPGATNMEFTTRINYAEGGGWCRIASARVSVKAKVILPQWRNRRQADTEVRLIWDTLARDIKRHEESHVGIAKNHARELEQSLNALPRRKTCQALAKEVEKTTTRLLAMHDAAQNEFDRIEAINFEDRMMRLLRYRLEQIEAIQRRQQAVR
jgi:predicted secreted Zn-dependent protease